MSRKLYEIIAKIMKVPITELSDSSGPETIENWDSYNGLLLVDELESEFNLSFTLAEMSDTHNVSDIKRHLKAHGVSLDD
jgi:acyl carrier protein